MDDAGEYALMLAIRALQEKGTTIVFITHKNNLINLAQKLLLIRDGSVLMYDKKEKVIEFLAQGSKTK